MAKGWPMGGQGVAKGWPRGGQGVAKGWPRGGQGVAKGWPSGVEIIYPIAITAGSKICHCHL